MCPRNTRETDGIAAKLLRCGIAGEALRRNMPLLKITNTPLQGGQGQRFWNRAIRDSLPLISALCPYPEGPARHLDVSRQTCLPSVSRQFLTRNYPRPNCLLKCLPNSLSPTREGFFPLSKIFPICPGMVWGFSRFVLFLFLGL